MVLFKYINNHSLTELVNYAIFLKTTIITSSQSVCQLKTIDLIVDSILFLLGCLLFIINFLFMLPIAFALVVVAITRIITR